MKIVGIICEYNPFHNGHKKQFDMIRQTFQEDCAIVCLMSGNYVQRGHPAIFDKSLRTQAALLSGADLVLELPVTCSLSSAEGFAAGGVKILSPFCDYLCFGTETGNADALMQAASALLSESFPPILRKHLESGISFPAARQQALWEMGIDGQILSKPNDILAVEYCKAILSQDSPMKPLPILRQGDYHDAVAQIENPSATALRMLITENKKIAEYIPCDLRALYTGAPIHTLHAAQRAILGRLRTMTDVEFEALPYGSEGLWRRFMHTCRSCGTLDEILQAVKTKRYTRSRLDRMVMCAFLGITDLTLPHYTRVLGFNSKGTQILNIARQTGVFPHIGDKLADDFQATEQRCDDLYGLFCENTTQPPRMTRRVVIQP